MFGVLIVSIFHFRWIFLGFLVVLSYRIFLTLLHSQNQNWHTYIPHTLFQPLIHTKPTKRQWKKSGRIKTTLEHELMYPNWINWKTAVAVTESAKEIARVERKNYLVCPHEFPLNINQRFTHFFHSLPFARALACWSLQFANSK